MTNRKTYQTGTTVYETFSKRLVLIMNVRGIRSRDLAEQTYVTRSTISDYRTGHRYPNIEQLRLLAICLQVTTDFLLGLSDEYDTIA